MSPSMVLGDRVLRLEGLPDSLLRLVQEELSYTKRESVFDPVQGRMLVDYRRVQLYEMVNGSALLAPIGFRHRIEQLLARAGAGPVQLVDQRDPSGEIEIDRSVLNDDGLRPIQRRILECMAEYERGSFQCPTGSGKSYVLSRVCRLFPKARIDIVTRRVDVARTIYRYVSPSASAGLCTSKMKTDPRRVMVYTIGSVHHGTMDADILIADEAHELATRASFEMLARYRPRRAYALSATLQHRFDRAHRELEGIFGPLLVDETYQSSVEHGSVVPIVVYWMPVEEGPVRTAGSRLYKRQAIWCNRARNEIVAAAANLLYRGGQNQTMVSVETVEHAFHLKEFLPDFKVVFAGVSSSTARRLISKGLVTEQELERCLKERDELRRKFEAGEVRGIIATDVWSTGVSFNDLAVVVRADAGVSGIRSIQIPGRVARLSDGKKCGIVVDFEDRFDRSLLAQSKQRRRVYEQSGWEQVDV